MKKIIVLCLLAATLFASETYAHETYRIENVIGIGAVLEKTDDGTVHVNALIPNAPAERAGLAAGDIIIEVRSLPGSPVFDVRSLSLADVVALIRGPVGVPVEVSFIRGQSEAIVLSIVREKIEFQDDEDE